MKIGDEVYVHGYVDEIRNGTIIIRNEGGYFGTAPDEVMPSAQTIEERKTGAWISDGVRFKGGHEWIHCSECGLETLDTPLNRTNYCPNCGCFMKEGNDKWVYR